MYKKLISQLSNLVWQNVEGLFFRTQQLSKMYLVVDFPTDLKHDVLFFPSAYIIEELQLFFFISLEHVKSSDKILFDLRMRRVPSSPVSQDFLEQGLDASQFR